MSRMIMVGQEEHRLICYNFVQFEAFGIMDFEEAIDQIEMGHLKTKEVVIPLFTESFTVISLTGAGRKYSDNMKRIWHSIYVPAMENDDFQLSDEYELNANHERKFAMSRQRFDREKQARRLSKVLNQCPRIDL